jgi:hypothetical protein
MSGHGADMLGRQLRAITGLGNVVRKASDWVGSIRAFNAIAT